MTSPRSTYGGGYYSASFPDTPIYDSLVAERGTPQIAPIRVPAAYDMPGSQLPALPSALAEGRACSPDSPTAAGRVACPRTNAAAQAATARTGPRRRWPTCGPPP